MQYSCDLHPCPTQKIRHLVIDTILLYNSHLISLVPILTLSLFINSKTLAFVSSLLYLVPPPTFHLIFPNIILFSFPSKAFTSEPPFSTYPELRPQWPWPTLSGRTWAGSYIGATSPTRGFSFSTDEDESGEYLLQDRNMSKGVVLGFRK